MDRRKKDELPKMQVGFIDFVCMPLYKILAELLPDLDVMHEGVSDNRKNWQTLADDPKGESWVLHNEMMMTLRIKGGVGVKSVWMHLWCGRCVKGSYS